MLSHSLVQLTSGEMSVTDFKHDLNMGGIKITNQLNQMLRHTAAGQPANFRKMGTEIFKQVEQTESVNAMFSRGLNPNDLRLENPKQEPIPPSGPSDDISPKKMKQI